MAQLRDCGRKQQLLKTGSVALAHVGLEKSSYTNVLNTFTRYQKYNQINK